MRDHPIKREMDRAISMRDKNKLQSPDVDRATITFMWCMAAMFCGIIIGLSIGSRLI